MLYIFEKGFNYSEDGPGNRLVYHLAACNLTCPWCSNPEGMERGAARACSVEELAREIFSARPMFFDGGGVTFTGGECTLQAEALVRLIARVRGEGVSAAIESNAATADFLRVAAACDVVIADYKHPSAERLKTVTGGSLALVEHNIKAFLQTGYLHLRIPLVHGFNDSGEALEGFLAFFASLPRERFDVELLPYHEYGRDKWKRLGKEYTVTDGNVTKDTTARFTEALRAHGIKTVKT